MVSGGLYNMKLFPVIVSLMLTFVGADILESELLLRKLVYYMPSLHTENIAMEKIGLGILHYGYVNSNCGTKLRKYQPEIEKQLFMDKRDRNLRAMVSRFYEFYIMTYGDYDRTIWDLFLLFIINNQAINKVEGTYDMLEYRTCDKLVTECHRYLAVRPRRTDFSKAQCTLLELYISEYMYRADVFALPVDYYALNVYVLSKLELIPIDLGYQNQAEKLFEMKYFLKSFLKTDKSEYERKFLKYLIYRDKRQELIEQDLKDCTDAVRKKKIEEQLKFHKMVTNMMVQGWMMVLEVTATDGKFEFTNQQGAKRVYEVPPITEFDSEKHP